MKMVTSVVPRSKLAQGIISIWRDEKFDVASTEIWKGYALLVLIFDRNSLTRNSDFHLSLFSKHLMKTTFVHCVSVDWSRSALQYAPILPPHTSSCANKRRLMNNKTHEIHINVPASSTSEHLAPQLRKKKTSRLA